MSSIRLIIAFIIVLIIVSNCQNDYTILSQESLRDSLLIKSTQVYKSQSLNNYDWREIENQVIAKSRNHNHWKKLSDSLKHHSAETYNIIGKGYSEISESNSFKKKEYYINVLNDYLVKISFHDTVVPKVLTDELRGLMNDVEINSNSNLGFASFLDRIENIVAYSEYRLSSFMINKVILGCGLSFSSTSLLIVQSSDVVSKGQDLVIIAGVGEFSRAAQPKFRINNEKVELENGGYVKYNLKVSSNPGTYKVPVEASYYNSEGLKVTDTIVIDYKVE